MGAELSQLGMAVGKALMPFVVTLLGILIAHGVIWLKAHTKGARMQGIEERLGNLALTVVQEIEQVVVSKLPERPTALDYEHAKQAALASLKLHLGPKGIDEIKKVMGWDETSLELVLESYIESRVHAVNQAAGVPLQALKVEGRVESQTGGVA